MHLGVFTALPPCFQNSKLKNFLRTFLALNRLKSKNVRHQPKIRRPERKCIISDA